MAGRAIRDLCCRLSTMSGVSQLLISQGLPMLILLYRFHSGRLGPRSPLPSRLHPPRSHHRAKAAPRKPSTMNHRQALPVQKTSGRNPFIERSATMPQVALAKGRSAEHFGPEGGATGPRARTGTWRSFGPRGGPLSSQRSHRRHRRHRRRPRPETQNKKTTE